MKKIISILLSFAIILSFSPIAFAAGDFQSGSGTEVDPYVITTLAQLKSVSSYSDAYFSLEADITEPLDTSLCGDGFTGNFDGNGHTITLALTTDDPNGFIFSGIGFGLFDINDGTISDLNVEGDVTGSMSNVGVIAGQNSGTITGCTSSATVNFISAEGILLQFPMISVGGIAGSNSGMISHSLASGVVNVDTVDASTGKTGLGYNIEAGGLIGWNDGGTVSDSSASGTVNAGTNDSEVNKGGLIGRCDEGSVTNCSATGDVPASSTESGADNQGGLIGYIANASIAISGCYATGDVTGGDSEGITRAGGLIGYDASLLAVSNCYATGCVSVSLSSTIKKAQAGGLIGYLTSSKVQNCYSTGSVIGTTNVSLGGLIGTVNSPMVTGCYWNTSTSGVNSGSSNSGVGIGLTTAQMTGTAASTNMSNLGYNTNFTAMENTSLSWYYPQLTALCGSSTSTKAASLASVAITTPVMTALSVSSGKISPNFSPDTTDYSVAVGDTVSSITLTPTIPMSGATIKVNGNSVSSGSTSGAIDISGVSNTITITITSSNGTYRNYNLTVTKLIPVTGIMAVPTTATVGTGLTLSGTVAPTDATNQSITWSVADIGTTGATISGSTLSTTSAGTVTVRATITDGTALGTVYTQDFTITVAAAFVPVTGIADVPMTATAGTDLTLSGTVAPTNATNQTITWNVKDAGTTGATISGSTLSTTGAGIVMVTATIADGTAFGTAYTQNFTITVSAAFVSVTGIADVPMTATAGTDLTLSGTVAPTNATNQTITWSVKDDGATGATISGSMLSTTGAGIVMVTATVTDGTASGKNYTKDFEIKVNAMAPTDKLLTSITTPAAITGVANGTAKTAAALGLPSTVMLVTDKGSVQANVSWDVASCSYDAGSSSAQIFTVSGTVTLPTGVVNTNSISLASSINVTVNKASSSNNGGGSGSGSSSGGESTSTTGNNSSITVTTDRGTTTAAQTFTARTGSNGVASANVTKTQIADMAKAAKEKAQEQNTQPALEIKVDSGSAATGVSVTIPQGAASSLTDGVKALTISSPIVMVTFDKKALAEIAKSATGDIVITASKSDDTILSDDDKAIIGGRPVYNLKVTVGSTTITSFGDGTATVSIPYTPVSGEDTSKIVIYYISGSGELVMVPDCVYDASTRTVIFKTKHFSSYAVGYNNVSFTDVSGWYADSVSYLAARDIITGTGNGKFSPDANITRAEFVTILANLSGNDLSGYTSSAFSDVATGSWYFGAVQWAYQNGIASGYNGNFSPNVNITREQMAVMLYNYAKHAGFNVSNVEEMSIREFSDYGSISNWAMIPIQWAMNNSIVSGNSDGSFAPMTYATRAQAAKIIALLLQGMVK